MKFTVLGARGFIGRHLVKHLESQGHQVSAVARQMDDLKRTDMGHVIYAIGYTGNFREHPYEAIDAHVTLLTSLLNGAEFDSWLYLSSTRVYGGLPDDIQASESTRLSVIPSADSLYDLSKLLGEAVCLGINCSAVRVARLSNVYGIGQSSATFLGSVLHSLQTSGEVHVREHECSSKDYVSVEDVVKMLEMIATEGTERVYNVASGNPVSHRQIASQLEPHGYAFTFVENAPVRTFPRIDITRISTAFGFNSRSILNDIALLIDSSSMQTKDSTR